MKLAYLGIQHDSISKVGLLRQQKVQILRSFEVSLDPGFRRGDEETVIGKPESIRSQ
jgi:hypothetical protein